MRKEKYITRQIGDKANGFFVRLPPFKNSNPHHSKYFAITNSVKNAFEAALRYRNAYLKQNGLLHLLKDRDSRVYTHHAFNRSGIIGVSRSTIKRAGKKAKSYWIATWSIGIESRNHAYAIHTLGEKRAFLLALETRYKKVGPIMITDKDKKFPCPIPRKFLK